VSPWDAAEPSIQANWTLNLFITHSKEPGIQANWTLNLFITHSKEPGIQANWTLNLYITKELQTHEDGQQCNMANNMHEMQGITEQK
jgi:hypothetical protein